MKFDLYTKLVLTVIACALAWLAVRPSIHPLVVSAQGPYSLVNISLRNREQGLNELGRTQGKVVGFTCAAGGLDCYALVQR